MPESSKTHRRRWPRYLAIAAVLSILSPFAWRYRPLNETERKLVGTWRSASGWTEMRLSADRVVSMGTTDGDPIVIGTWRTSATALYMTSSEPDPRVVSLSWYRQILPWIRGERHATEACLIEFDDPDSAQPATVEWGPGLETWTRVAP